MLGIFLDTETNGLNIKNHSIIEIAYKILNLNTGEVKYEYEAISFVPLKKWEKSDLSSLKINGFSWIDVMYGKKNLDIKREIKRDFKNLDIRSNTAVFICHNPSFDRAFFNQLIDPGTQKRLGWPYHWLDLASMYYMKSILNKKLFAIGSRISKDRIAEEYGVPSEEIPHKAMNGVNHLIKCYEALVGFPNIR